MSPTAEAADAASAARSELLGERLIATRRRSLEIAEPLSPEDMTVQAMDDASPTKWHLAHVTWFFETFLLVPFLDGYERFDPSYGYCFNSYYESVGARHPRPLRGLLTRPSCGEVMAYRAHVDEGLGQLLDGPRAGEPEIVRLVELGINHEQQHQELMLTDILALFAASPIAPAYLPTEDDTPSIAPAPPRWLAIDGGKLRVGHDGHGFAWDNEGPAHDVLIGPFRVADRLVTNAEWLEFMADGGYREPLLWLADGWGAVQREGWEAPGYWRRIDGAWHQTTLHGRAPVEPAAPVAHVSYFEADAFARWAGARLPTEHEWEAAVARLGVRSGERGATRLAPSPCAARLDHRLHQAFGDVWQWTQSAYLPYPGYRPPKGAIGEYNGKFMVSQHVLRGSSAITAAGHARVTYRNFFYPHQRWQMAGVRLAEAP